VRPHADAEKAEAEPIADHLALAEVARGLGAGLVQVRECRAGQLELPCGLEADGPVGAAQRNDVAVLAHWLPAEFGEAHQKIADAAFLVIARRAVIVAAEDELL